MCVYTSTHPPHSLVALRNKGHTCYQVVWGVRPKLPGYRKQLPSMSHWNKQQQHVAERRSPTMAFLPLWAIIFSWWVQMTSSGATRTNCCALWWLNCQSWECDSEICSLRAPWWSCLVNIQHFCITAAHLRYMAVPVISVIWSNHTCTVGTRTWQATRDDGIRGSIS